MSRKQLFNRVSDMDRLRKICEPHDTLGKSVIEDRMMNFAKTFLTGLWLAFAGTFLHGATFIVTNTFDSGSGSLREAVFLAYTNAGPDTISLSNVSGRITLLSPTLPLRDVTITGPGARQLTTAWPAIVINSTATSSIVGLRLESAVTNATNVNGGIIWNMGTLTLQDCELIGTRLWESRGGAIYNDGNLTLNRSTIASNIISYASDRALGGGLYVKSGSVQIINSTFSGNVVSNFGYGGAIYVETGSVTLVNCTLAGNSSYFGDSIYNQNGSVTLQNSIATLATLKLYGLYRISSVSPDNLATNLEAAGLGPLQDNGGLTLTHALLPTSPAIDRGISTGAPPTDQRGVLRPQGPRVDSGAFELPNPPILFQLSQSAGTHGVMSVVPDRYLYSPNTMVEILATAEEDYVLDHWSGDVSGNTNPMQVLMNRDKSVSATFRYAPYTRTNASGSTNLVTNTNGWGPGSFRQAVRDLVASGGGSIHFSNLAGTISLPLGLPPINGNAIIRGPVPDRVMVSRPPFGTNLLFSFLSGTSEVSGVGIDRSAAAIGISTGATLRLRNVKMRQNAPAIGNQGRLIVENSVFEGNARAINSEGSLSLFNSAFQGNYQYGMDSIGAAPFASGPSGASGGALALAGTAQIVNCTFADNSVRGGSGADSSTYGFGGYQGADATGGAIFFGSGSLMITNTTFSGNVARGGRGGLAPQCYARANAGLSAGGGIYASNGTVFLQGVTFISNRAEIGGFAYYGSPAAPCGSYLCCANGAAVHFRRGGGNLRNTLVAFNSSQYGSNVAMLTGTYASSGFNLIRGDNDSAGWLASDILQVDPRVGPLQYNGGPTPTHALLAGSPAIDAGANSGLAFDQRGQPRPLDHPGVPNAPGSDGTDIGAFEVDPVLRFTGLSRANSNVQVSFTTVSDKSYGVQYRSNVLASPWVAFPDVIPGSGGIVTFTNVGAVPPPAQFYRAFER
jgi:hypothetical protein